MIEQEAAVTGLAAREAMGTERHAPKVCHLTTVHKALDNRIFDKQAVSLAKAGYRVTIIGRHDRAEVRDGVRIVPLPTLRSRSLRRMAACFGALRLALRERADVYQFHDAELLFVGLILRLFGKTVVYDAHEDYRRNVLSRDGPHVALRRPLAETWWLLERLGARLFSWVIVADERIEVYSAATRKTVIANPPPQSFSEVRRNPTGDGTLKLLFLGMIAEQRGINEIVAALDLLRNDRTELHVVGATENADLLALFARHPKIVYHGRVPWHEVRARLAEADVGLLLFQPNPALLNVSGKGNTKLFEFMAAGIPVLVSDFPNLREFLDPIGACLPVDPTNPKQIAEAIDYLYENPHVRREMGENGRKAVRERYNWEAEEKKLLAIYRELLGERARPATRPAPLPEPNENTTKAC